MTTPVTYLTLGIPNLSWKAFELEIVEHCGMLILNNSMNICLALTPLSTMYLVL